MTESKPEILDPVKILEDIESNCRERLDRVDMDLNELSKLHMEGSNMFFGASGQNRAMIARLTSAVTQLRLLNEVLMTGIFEFVREAISSAPKGVD